MMVLVLVMMLVTVVMMTMLLVLVLEQGEQHTRHNRLPFWQQHLHQTMQWCQHLVLKPSSLGIHNRSDKFLRLHHGNLLEEYLWPMRRCQRTYQRRPRSQQRQELFLVGMFCKP
jgi:hypothetical protein